MIAELFAFQQVPDRPREMTEAEFEAAYRAFTDVWGAEFSGTSKGKVRQNDLRARRAQAFATLASGAGWTPERLAGRFGKTPRWADCNIRFGRFLYWAGSTMVVVDLTPLNEQHFRSLWAQTDQIRSEIERFAEVARLLEADPPISERTTAQRATDRKIGQGIARRFADTKWHRPATIAKDMQVPIEDVAPAVLAIPKDKVVVERRGGGGKEEYRIIRLDKMISAFRLIEELGPLIKAIVNQTRLATEHPVHNLPAVLLTQAQLIQLKFDELTQ